MLCPLCNSEWPDEIRYCGACGARMPEATLVTGPAHAQVEATQPASKPERPIPEPPVVANSIPPLTNPPALPRSLFSDESSPAIVSPAQPLVVDSVPRPVTLAPGHFTPAREDPVTAPEQATPIPHVELQHRPPELVVVDVLAEAWLAFQRRWPPFVLGTLIISLAASALAGTIVGVVAWGPLFGGLVIAALRHLAGRPIELDDFFHGFRRAVVPLIVTGVLSTLAITLGFALLVVPGLYLSMVLAYAPFFVIDRGLAPWPAMRASIETVHARLGAHLSLCVVLAAAQIAGSLVFGVGVLVSLPFAVLALGVAYRRVVGSQGGVDTISRD